MKTLISSAILLLALAIFVNAKPHHGPPLPPHIQEARDACLKELDISEENYHKGKREGEYKTEDCVSACISKRIGLIDKDGKIDKEVAKKNFPPHISEENITTIVEACHEEKGKNDCETAVLYRKCMWKLAPRPPMDEEKEKIKNECQKELNLTDEDLKKLRETREETNEDCFLHCLGKKFGNFNEDGTVNKEGVLKRAPSHELERIGTVADECAKETVGANACETAYKVHKCFRKNDVNFGHHFGPPPPAPGEE